MSWPTSYRVENTGWISRSGALVGSLFEHWPTEGRTGKRTIRKSNGTIGYIDADNPEFPESGWIRLNGDACDLTGFNANGVRPTGWSSTGSCGGAQVLAMNVFVPYTEMVIVMNRLSGVGQCMTWETNSRIAYDTGYWTTPTYNGRYIPYGQCNWGDFIWAKGTNSNDISGIQNNWVIRLKNMLPGEQVRLRMACHSASGTHNYTFYVR